MSIAISAAAVQAPVTATAAPWWQVPALAGAFVLIGASIAFVSTFLSDMRKLKREDRRQWDKEVRDAYVRASAAVSAIKATRYSTLSDWGAEYANTSAARDELRGLVRQLRIIASPRLLAAAESVSDAAANLGAIMHDRFRPPKELYRALAAADEAFLEAVQAELRLRPKRNVSFRATRLTEPLRRLLRKARL